LNRIAAGNQAREETRRHAAGDTAAMQMPEIVMLQPRPETRHVAALSDRLVARQVLAEKLAGHRGLRKRGEAIVTKVVPVEASLRVKRRWSSRGAKRRGDLVAHGFRSNRVMRLHAVLFAIGAWILQREAALPDLRYA